MDYSFYQYAVTLSFKVFVTLRYVLLNINIAPSIWVSICLVYVFLSLLILLCFRCDFYEQNLAKFWIFQCNEESVFKLTSFSPVTFIVINDTLGFIYNPLP